MNFILSKISRCNKKLGEPPVGLEESKRNASSRQTAKRLLAKFGWARADFDDFAGQ
ncbi:MAG TPA: hypothetical protein VFN66_03390 [Burkholderiales bacterium]|nr:hypothetical protein [Burkholderiales bacterium]